MNKMKTIIIFCLFISSCALSPQDIKDKSNECFDNGQWPSPRINSITGKTMAIECINEDEHYEAKGHK